jgi:hypothetical protein
VTHPSVESAQSGEAADAVRTLQAGLRGDYSEIRSAEIQLTEAILTAHAVTVSGRNRLQDIQRQLIEAITNPVTALGTPAGERQFLMFLRNKVAEIQDVVDGGALSDEDHARLTRALASGYLLAAPQGPDAPAPGSGGAPTADQAAGIMPAVGSALGALPQAAQGAVAGPAQGASGLAGAATPLAGLASGLLDRPGDDSVDTEPTHAESRDDEPRDKPQDEHDDEADRTDTDESRPSAPPSPPPGDRETPERGPAPTRPAVARQEAP